mmetsp:Transcript_71804/g.149996  ORF Transcript_71804/g.149996 Transcript_71804/m.149996 type:complete len:106 (+) Transcript_71804:2353-2670(+)
MEIRYLVRAVWELASDFKFKLLPLGPGLNANSGQWSLISRDVEGHWQWSLSHWVTKVNSKFMFGGLLTNLKLLHCQSLNVPARTRLPSITPKNRIQFPHPWFKES